MKNLKGIVLFVVLFAMLMLTYFVFSTTQNVIETKTMSDLLQVIENDKVSRLVVNDTSVVATLKDNTQMSVSIPSVDVFLTFAAQEIKELAQDPDFVLETPAPQEMPWWLTMMPYIVVGIVILVFWIIMFRQMQGGGGGKVMNFGKSRAKVMNQGQRKITFKDVAGADEEKADLEEMVDFLRNPAKYTALGARIPKGVLLVGPPGTGKTLLAKAVAGEANVPFFSISGSDFVEMFVGVGAARVRDLFEEAKKSTPAVIFIDEIDAVGRQRGAGLGGGHDEREQTLNQLLVEMDGFGVNEGIIMIAATNRPDILDPALLRPGRFDRQIVVNSPDVKGREDILKVHSKNKKLASDIDLKVVAQTTAGFTGADLENLLNEAALLAARKNKKNIDNDDIQTALMKVMMGAEKKSRAMNEEEKRLTAIHEAGHAVITRLMPDQDPVHEVSIIPRGMAGGYTMHLPTEDRYYTTKTYMYNTIRILLGGRAAEKVALGDISTGASNDIERATELARKMVMKYGMSDVVGPICYGSSSGEVFLGRDFTQSHSCSDQQEAIIDAEVRNIVETCYEDCLHMLSENRAKLELIANALVEFEKLDGESFEQLFVSDEQQASNDETVSEEKGNTND